MTSAVWTFAGGMVRHGLRNPLNRCNGTVLINRMFSCSADTQRLSALDESVTPTKPTAPLIRSTSEAVEFKHKSLKQLFAEICRFSVNLWDISSPPGSSKSARLPLRWLT